jgi:Mrp family chromosome partitioning ATPase
MERIKLALDRAKAERDAIRAPFAEVVPIIADRGETQPELTGRFLKTRELPVDPEQLRRGRLLTPGLQGDMAQSFKMLRTQVLQRLRSRGWNTLGIVSSTPGEGKTTIAINLAMAISMDPGHSALLVDFDLRKPGVARRLGLDVTSGVEDVLVAGRPVADAFVRLTGYDRLMILPTAASVLQSSELLGAEPARALVEELKTRYPDRIVLFDLPPLLGADDTLAFLPRVDAVLLVVAEAYTRTEHLTRALELLKDKPIVGTVLNRSRSGADAYYAY